MALPFEPLTAQYGDKTYWGEWAFDGEVVHVTCDLGQAQRAAEISGKPIITAERLLIELFRSKGQL